MGAFGFAVFQQVVGKGSFLVGQGFGGDCMVNFGVFLVAKNLIHAC